VTERVSARLDNAYFEPADEVEEAAQEAPEGLF
jgi:hypothetical protein